ncbi:dihydrodipicolinate synthetase [Moniliophthora roreri MCA 2997]|uniref:Dihydrodipicolinate synthetase n=2 Tax=Moniliophthora roreri TaxID=221103 RepID=V2XMD5_MONRO|nr:dihydrodipicolinate synthetase [Moniliophthora roreri MCA 2997]KAI3619788.1 dihydrodipicolinate synthetase [Moniliophthora roreri]
MPKSAPPPGYYVPSVLFLSQNEDIDIPATKAHILRLAQGGVTGILVQGSNGEAQFLSHDERRLAIRLARQTLNENDFPNVLVIAGTGAQSTRETIKLCIDAKEAGASHVLVLTPSTWPPQMTVDNIINFHIEVADASPLPCMIYNFPVVTAGIDLDSDTIATLASHPNIVGTKLSCGNIGKLQRLASKFPSSDFAVFAGRSDFFTHGLLSGSAGTIAATVNILPKVHGKIIRLVRAGKITEAMELQAQLGHADWAVQKIGGIGGVKAIVSQNFGYGRNVVRKPLKVVQGESLKSNKYYDAILKLIELEKSIYLE